MINSSCHRLLVDEIGLCSHGPACSRFTTFDDTIGTDEWQDELAKNILYEFQIWQSKMLRLYILVATKNPGQMVPGC
jgi:hypothetical protein